VGEIPRDAVDRTTVLIKLKSESVATSGINDGPSTVPYTNLQAVFFAVEPGVHGMLAITSRARWFVLNQSPLQEFWSFKCMSNPAPALTATRLARQYFSERSNKYLLSHAVTHIFEPPTGCPRGWQLENGRTKRRTLSLGFSVTLEIRQATVWL